MKKLPTFTIIGASKSGTSSLHQYLNQHPEIFFSPVKEPHFFSALDQKNRTLGPGDSRRTANSVFEFNDYMQLFQKAQKEKAIGEASTTYISSPTAPQRIYDFNPEMKLIVIFRNPVERAFSAYMHLVRDGDETEKTFGNALDKEAERKAKGWDGLWLYRERGHYYTQLSRYFNLFPQNQIKVFLFEDLKKDPLEVVTQLFEFLEVDSSFQPTMSYQMNPSGVPRIKLLQNFINNPGFLKTVLKSIIPKQIRMRLISKANTLNLQKQKISDSDKAVLTEYYREEICKLQELIGRDLSHWLKA